MTPADLVAEASAAGVRLFIRAGRIKAAPGGRLAPRLKAAIQADRAAVRAVLERAQAPDACSVCGSYAWLISLVDETGNRTCFDCATGRTTLRRAGVPI